MMYFGTLFDKNYLAKGLALHYSMELHISGFQLFVLCLDEATHFYLTNLSKPTICPIRLADVEAEFPQLAVAKSNRSTIEYYFTLSPAWPLYLLKRFPHIEHITTLDADIYFFSNPTEVYDEFESKSILITPHRFPGFLTRLRQYGLFNVSYQVFRNDSNGLSCLNWWFDRCLEWCYDRLEGARFADQKYLDEFPARFHGVGIIQHEGAGLAPWNISNYRISMMGGRFFSNGRKLIYFHFHYLKQVKRNWFLHGLDKYYTAMSSVVRKGLYGEYINTLSGFSLSPESQPGDHRWQAGKSGLLSLLRTRPVLWRNVFGGINEVDVRRLLLLLHKMKNGLLNRP